MNHTPRSKRGGALNRDTLLFSVDLEDVRDWVKGGERYRERVPINTERYLKFLSRHGVQATFFVVGALARKYPSLIREIASEKHEIACHGDKHIQLDKLSPQTFYTDLQNNIDALDAAGATNIVGFRAPTFSLTGETAWAYEVLDRMGFKYSSSVLPATNPLYGWPDFGSESKKMTGQLWEIPITLHKGPLPPVPMVGGVYFRIIPFSVTKYALQRAFAGKRPVLAYLHPYDIDAEQERFMHPDLNNNWFMNKLMYIGRSRVLDRLEKIAALYEFESYRTYIYRNLVN